MSTVAEIASVLPQLSTDELLQVEQALHQQYRQRNDRIVYDDAYGVVTDADLIAEGDQAFLEYDKEESKNAAA